MKAIRITGVDAPISRPLLACLLLACLLMALPASALAAGAAGQPGGISLADALEMASRQNPEVVIGQARRARAEAVRLQARQAVLPAVSFDATYMRAELGLLDVPSLGLPTPDPLSPWISLNPVEGNVLGVQLLQPLVNVSAWHGRDQAARQLEAARLRLGRIADEVAVNTMDAYFAVVTAAAQRDAEARGLAASRRVLAQAEAGYREGLVPRLDVLNARTRVAEMAARVSHAEAVVVAAQSALREALGSESDAPLKLTDPVPDPPRELAPPGGAPAGRDDLRAMEKAVAAAESGAKGARAGYLPDLSLFARYQQVDLNAPMNYDDTDWIVGVSLSWTVFSGFGVRGAIDEAEAVASEKRAELDARRRHAASEARNTRARWRAELSAWETATESQAVADEALELAQRSYEEGLGDMTELLLAQSSALQASTRALHARYQAVMAAQRHLLAIGAQEAGRLGP